MGFFIRRRVNEAAEEQRVLAGAYFKTRVILKTAPKNHKDLPLMRAEGRLWGFLLLSLLHFILYFFFSSHCAQKPEHSIHNLALGSGPTLWWIPFFRLIRLSSISTKAQSHTHTHTAKTLSNSRQHHFIWQEVGCQTVELGLFHGGD